MTHFRPCIDLHQGRVKQIVGGTLSDQDNSATENHVADHPAQWFASKYRDDGLTGGHVIKLGPGNDAAATAAIAAFPGGLQIGGGITIENAKTWLDRGASHVIVTSWLFDQNGQLDDRKLKQLSHAIGKDRVVIDLSCRRTAAASGNQQATWHVASNRWQTLTRLEITHANLDWLSGFAAEFLIHAADVEGLCGGVDRSLVRKLGRWGGLPMTYAGGVAGQQDIEFIEQASDGKLDYTVGSALDLFGGTGVRYADLIQKGVRYR